MCVCVCVFLGYYNFFNRLLFFGCIYIVCVCVFAGYYKFLTDSFFVCVRLTASSCHLLQVSDVFITHPMQ